MQLNSPLVNQGFECLLPKCFTLKSSTQEFLFESNVVKNLTLKFCRENKGELYRPTMVFFFLFFYKDLVATTGVSDLLFAGGGRRPKNLKNPKKKKKKK